MKLTREMPVAGAKRTRQVYAFLPKWFDHGSLNKPLRTMVWFDYYTIEECFDYGFWRVTKKRLTSDDAI